MVEMYCGEKVDEELTRLRRGGFHRLSFHRKLEEQFEQDTAKERSYRLWLEGFVAIVVFNGCLTLDDFFVRDMFLRHIVLRTVAVTPLALVVNGLMRLNPRKWIREGSVALGVSLICLLNLYVEDGRTAATATFGLLTLLITVLFANVVMRLRFPFAVTATAVMSLDGAWFLWQATGPRFSEKVVGGSIVLIGIVMTLTAGYGLEKEERLGYLLQVRSQLQGKELAVMNTELQRLSNMDKLTGLPNRRGLEDQFERLWEEGIKAQSLLSAIVVDVDHFKVLNDVYGHLYGDDALRRIATLITKALRAQGDYAARFGGEEFVVLLPATERENALVVAERIRSLVEVAGSPMAGQGAVEPVMWATVSCGVSCCMPGGEMRKDDLLRAADSALYEAKSSGRNRVEFHACEHVSGVRRWQH